MTWSLSWVHANLVELGFLSEKPYPNSMVRRIQDELTKHIRNDIFWCMLFADDIVLIEETKYKVNAKLEV